jgi:hypothetical protein
MLFSKYLRRFGPWTYKFVWRWNRGNAIVILWIRFGLPSSVIYILCQQCLCQPHVNFIRALDLEVFKFSEKMTWFAIYFVLWTEFSTCESTILKRRLLDLFCNYHHIHCVCNHSTKLVVIFFVVIFHLAIFWHTQYFIVI